MALRWGILGASKIARDFMLAMKTLPDGENEVVAIGSSSELWAKSFAENNAVPKWYGSYEQLVRDPNVQIVYVAGVSATHAKCCKLALNNGKHVLCEKPFALNLRETKEVSQLAKEKKLFIMEALWTRFFPLYHYLQSELMRNAVGDVKSVMASLGASLEHVPRLTDPRLGGSILRDIGIYTLNFADIVFGGEKPESIQASGHLFDNGVDHTVSITLLYSNKRIAQLLCSGGALLPNSATIVGNKGTISLDKPFYSSERITGPNGSKDFPLPETVEPTFFKNSSGLRYEIDAVRKNIIKGELEHELMPHSMTIRITGYMDEIRQQIGVTFD